MLGNYMKFLVRTPKKEKKDVILQYEWVTGQEFLFESAAL
jgi:hypothetical protein